MQNRKAPIQSFLTPKFPGKETTRASWEKLHNSFLSEWNDCYLRIDELWPGPSEAVEERRKRFDRWVEFVIDSVGCFKPSL